MVTIGVQSKTDTSITAEVTNLDSSTDRIDWLIKKTSAGTFSLVAQTSETDTDLTYTGLDDGEAYDLRAETYDSNGNFIDGDETTETTNLPAPTNLSTSQSGEFDVDVSWDDNASTEDEYRVEVRLRNTQSFVTLATLAPDTTSTTVSLPTGAGVYEVDVIVATEDTSSVTTTTHQQSRDTYSVSVINDTDDLVELTAGDILQIDITREYNAIHDLQVRTVFDEPIRDRALQEVRAYAASGIVFRGDLRDFDWDADNDQTIMQAAGVLYDTKDGSITRTFTRTAIDDAIDDVWTNNTGFTATVQTPSATSQVSAKTVVDVSTQSELESYLNAAATDPIYVTAGPDIELAQSLFLYETEFATGQNLATDASGTIQNSSGEAIAAYYGGEFGVIGDDESFTFTLDYRIPDGNVAWAIRYKPIDKTGDGNVDDLPPLRVLLNGTEISSFVDRWGSNTPGDYRWLTGNSADIGGLDPGSHDFRIVQNGPSDTSYDEVEIDLFCVYDDRFSYNFDNTITQSGTGDTGDENYLDGPELRPDGYYATFDTTGVQFRITDVSLTSSGWNDTGGSQSVEVSVDGGATWFSASNSTSITQSIASSTYSKTIDVRIQLDRFGSQQDTPANGFNGQHVSSITVDYDGDDYPMIQSDTFRGNPYDILMELADRGNYRHVVDHAATDANNQLQKTVESFPVDSIVKSAPWAEPINRSPSQSFYKYANRFTLYGAKGADGTRPSVTVEDSGEVSTYGVEADWDIDPELTTTLDVRAAAREILRARIRERNLTGSLTVAPVDVLPGYTYPVDWFGTGTTTDTPNETVSIRESDDNLESVLEFEQTIDIVTTVIEQDREVLNTKRGI